jgi:hypothetical protein
MKLLFVFATKAGIYRVVPTLRIYHARATTGEIIFAGGVNFKIILFYLVSLGSKLIVLVADRNRLGFSNTRYDEPSWGNLRKKGELT